LAPADVLPTDGIVESLRLVKDADEVQAIRRAVELTSEVFSEFIGEIKPGRSERELAAELEYRLRRAGAEKIAFDTIIASGARSALPHGIASNKRIGYNEFVVLDFGAIVEGYSSDMTRTVYMGTPDAQAKQIYNIVLEAQLNCEHKMRAGMKAEEVDDLTRAWITERGYGEYYWHSTGHGIGLEVHEAPRVGKNSDSVVPAGAVITVEPGIYLPDWGGVRIEDVVVVGPHGSEVLTPSPKELVAL
jgi:Xaa-Pro aminopeptidase